MIRVRYEAGAVGPWGAGRLEMPVTLEAPFGEAAKLIAAVEPGTPLTVDTPAMTGAHAPHVGTFARFADGHLYLTIDAAYDIDLPDYMVERITIHTTPKDHA